MTTAVTHQGTQNGAHEDYPFGLSLPQTQYSNPSYSQSIQYGFNGKEQDTDLQSDDGSNLVLDYGFRIYNPAVARFLSVDPLTRSYPELTPYQFASNRPVDGVDLDGAEYLTYKIKVYNEGSGISMIKIADYRNLEDFDYNKYSESFGPEGRGIKYIYEFLNENNEVIQTKTLWEIRQGSALSKSALGRHGFFYGSGAKTYLGPLYKPGVDVNTYDWGVSPIDGPDAIALKHDLDQDEKGTFNWLEDNRTLAGDRIAIESWNQYVLDYDGTDKIDQHTGRKASNEAIRAAKSGSSFFNVLVRYKEWKIKEMESRGLDPNNVDDMKKITIDDYKGKWHQIKRNIEQKILKSASSDTPK